MFIVTHLTNRLYLLAEIGWNFYDKFTNENGTEKYWFFSEIRVLHNQNNNFTSIGVECDTWTTSRRTQIFWMVWNADVWVATAALNALNLWLDWDRKFGIFFNFIITSTKLNEINYCFLQFGLERKDMNCSMDLRFRKVIVGYVLWTFAHPAQFFDSNSIVNWLELFIWTMEMSHERISSQIKDITCFLSNFMVVVDDLLIHLNYNKYFLLLMSKIRFPHSLIFIL